MILLAAISCPTRAAARSTPSMTPVALTGFNRDVVVEDTAQGPPFTNYASEMNAGEGTAFYQTGLPQYAWGLPPSGAFVSLVGDGTIFQFQPYTTNNALVLSPDTGLTNGTLELVTQAAYARIAILAHSGDGTNETGTLTLKFSDGSSMVTTFYAPDWFRASGNVAWFGPGRINLTTGTDSAGPEKPLFFQTTVNVAALMGATNKPLASIFFGKTVSQSTAIYAVSGLLAGSAPPPSTPIAATGWNQDLVIENTASGPPYNASASELNPGENKAYYQAGLTGATYGLPRDGSFSSLLDGTVFQLQPYTGNNALDMSRDTGTNQGTLNLAVPELYDSLSLLANSSGGGGTPDVTIHFSDGTTLVTNFNAQDWFNGSLNVAWLGFDRINLTTAATDGGPTNPRFYQTTYDLTALFGVTNKPISSLTFDKAAGAGATAVYALSGVAGEQGSGSYTLASVTNSPAASIQTSGAVLGGNVVATGGAAPEVFIYYGSADGGTNAANWNQAIYLGFEGGSFAQNVAGLSMNSTYYYRAAAINPAGVAWAPASQSFSTINPSLASVTNLPATNVGPNAAILAGNVLATGGDAPAMTIFYGTSNGGNQPGAWSNNLALPATQSGWFGQAVSSLTPNTTYFFTAQAINGAGISWGAPVQSFTTPAALLPSQVFVSVPTGRNDNGRTGQNTNETILTPANVNTNTFGLLYSHTLDGYLLAQPLVLANVALPGQGLHNLLFAATEHDDVYAFDADVNGPPIWHVSFIDPAAGVTPIETATDLLASTSPSFYGPELGISGTPVIDSATGTLYVEANTKEVAGNVTNFVHRLHALDVVTGAEKFGGPVVIQGAVPGVGDGFDPLNGVEFDPAKHMNRPALLLDGGVVCVMFTSHQDYPPYHGWVFTFNAYTLEQEGVFNTTPNGSAGGIWQAGSGPAADAAGNIYVETGNGTFDAVNQNYGDSVVKFSPAGGLVLLDYFAPANQLDLNLEDLDIGSAGLILLPDAVGSAAHPHLLVAGSKAGVFWLLDRDQLGQFNAAGDTQIPQEITGATGSMWVTPAYFNGAIYYCAAGDNAKAFAITNGAINTTPASQSTVAINYPGSSLEVSANGVSNAIVWGLDSSANQSGPAVLNAYDGTNLALELYSSSQNPARDNPGLAIKYTMPTVANGKVYVGAVDALSVFGNISYLAPPVISPNGGIITNSVTVSLSSLSNGVSIYYTLDGSTPTTHSILYAGPFSLTNGAAVRAVGVVAGQPNSPVASARFTRSASLSPYEAAVVADGPLAYWPLNETNGLVAYNLVGGNNGTYVGDVTLAQAGVPLLGFGSPSYSVLFDGASAYVDIPEGPFNITGAITTMAWLNVPATPPQFSGLMGHGDSSWRTSVNTLGEPGADDGSNADATGTNSIAGTGWHMMVYTYTGIPDVTDNGSLYLDGVLAANNTVSVPAGDGLDIWIGGSPDYGTQRLLPGSIAHAAIFTQALSSSQIVALYNAGSIAPIVTLNLGPAGAGSLTLTWSQGTVLQSTSLAGPWTTNTAASPYTLAPTQSQVYFKVLVNE